MKILCFSPNDAIWNWAFPQALALEALKQRGHEIVYVSCEREFSGYCMSMAASGVAYSSSKEEKEQICAKCVRQSRMLQQQFEFHGHPINHYLPADARREADVLSARDSLSELHDFSVFGVPAGRLALYETVIQNKLADARLDKRTESFYRTILRNTYLTVVGLHAALEQEKPDVCVTYHTAYAYNRAFQLLGEARGCPVYFMNLGFNVAKADRQLIISHADPEKLFRRLLENWKRFAEVPCTASQLAGVTDHLLGLMKGQGFAYSVAIAGGQGAAIQRLGIPPGRKVLLATMSSYDELLASELAGFGWTTRNDVFSSQVEWIDFLFAYISRRPDLHLIVRPHPRELQVRGQGVRSQHSYQLEEAFKNHPENVTINWATDQISLYDILVETDVVLNAWSTAGMEAGLFGIPVVSHCGDVLMYPRELVFDVVRKEDYASDIEKALASGWSIERVRRYYRWAVLMLDGTAVDIADAMPGIHGRRSLVQRFARRLLRAVQPDWEERAQIRRRPQRLRDADRITVLVERNHHAFYELDPTAQSAEPLEAEMKNLRVELRRLAAYLAERRGSTPTRLLSYLD